MSKLPPTPIAKDVPVFFSCEQINCSFLGLEIPTNNIIPLLMSKSSSIDIDTQKDLVLAQTALNKRMP